jgi:hypothetical protein
MPHGRDALAARFTRAWSAKCARAPYPDLFEAIGVCVAAPRRVKTDPLKTNVQTKNLGTKFRQRGLSLYLAFLIGRA